ncbi:class I SAM-dependent methyltransferase [Marispirochaeta sp.]|uniref:class I SAM-dependent methyltransferase n=1 Tax=Marispirochaeta sp. TaxID=2038653 RepID=UPI0029C7533B|nr:class I SAM-dependent methyltransferase [Marispirochaeta sp.]
MGFVICPDCTLVYQNPQPVIEDLARRYDDEYFEYELENEEAFFSLMRMGLDDIGFPDIVGDLPRRFLDVGCATGKLISHVKDLGFSEQGVEICAPSARYGIEKRGVNIFIGTLEEAAFSAESFGIVHCSHLIEHLTDPALFAAEVYRVLVPGGFFILTTPDIHGMQARLFGEDWRSAIHDHMVLFSRRTLRRLLEDRGFRVEKRRSWGGLAAGTAPILIKKTADTLCKLINQGDVMIMLARKPA